jgi:S1-C subfamily serine protease
VRIVFHGLRWFLLAGGLALRAAAADSGSGNAPPVQMEKYTVSGKHLLCFGLGLELWEDKNTGRVLAMYVKAVQPDSHADLEGIVPGTRIWSVNATPVEKFPATFAEGSPLNRIFVDRQNGDQVTLEFTRPGKRGTRVVTLIQYSALTVTIRKPQPAAEPSLPP